jgi:hypothetical protein
MLTSNFELLVTRIASVTGPPFRRIVSGHFLTVSNLDPSRTINLNARLTITTSVGNNTITTTPPSLTNNVQFIFDNGSGVNNSVRRIFPLASNPSNSSFITAGFSLGPKQTGLVAILPVLTPGLLANPDLEIRGFAELTQNRRRFGGPFGSQIIDFNAIPPADVLFTPETRGTFLDDAFPTTVTTDELDFDQIGYALPTANGKARDTIEGLPPIVLQLRNFSMEELRTKNPFLSDDEVEEVFGQVSAVLNSQGANDKL